jgi:acyl-CoA hydrolase
MLASAPSQGVHLLNRVLDVAAVRARAALGAPVVLRRCSDIELREEIGDLHFEAWCVRKDDEGLAVVVTATAQDEGGCECLVASGRFLFSTFAAPSASIVTRLGRLGSPKK